MRSVIQLVLVLAMWTAAVAQAQQHPDPATMDAAGRHEYAVQLTQQANDAYRDDRFQEAADLYLLAYEYEQTPVLLFNTGRAYHRAGRSAVAVEFYWMALETNELDEDTTQRAQDYVQQLFDEAVDSAMRDSINNYLDRAAAAEGAANHAQAARLYLQAYQLPPDPIFSDLDILVSNADQLLLADDYEGAMTAYRQVLDNRWVEEEQRLRADEGLQVATERQRLATAVAEEPEVPVEPPSKGLSGLQITGLVVAGAGVATLVGGIIVDAGLSGTIDDYEAAAEAGDSEQYSSLADDIDSGQTLAMILYIGGGVLVGAGTVLFLVGGSDDEPAAGEGSPETSLLPRVAPMGHGLGLHWEF
ncbi:MAG: hypothetical protein JW797_19475 [Bradymonadales bacterium]|nr:hypothetical protein [Bradymonadales bacterium]